MEQHRYKDLFGLHEKLQETIRTEWQGEHVEVAGYISGIRYKNDGSANVYVKSFRADRHLQLLVLCDKNVLQKTGTPEVGCNVTVYGNVFLGDYRLSYMIRAKRLTIGNFAKHEAKKRADEATLKSKGVFSDNRKKRRDDFSNPRSVALITSPNSRACGDIKNHLHENPDFHGELLPHFVPVDGEKAAKKITEKIKELNGIPPDDLNFRPDVIILSRGGGHTDKLSAFFDPDLAEAIAESSIPIVTGIGHAGDKTFACRAADYDASTPTGAAAFIGDLYRERLR